jgi:nicotinamidase-related amidase
VEDVEKGRWKFNPVIGQSIGASPDYGQKLLLHYTKQLREKGKYELTIWPYHSMVGGIGHALVSAMEEAVFFHTVARYHQADLIIKGTYPLTESYSAIGPEVEKGYRGEKLGDRSKQFLDKVVLFDVMIIAGQAKSHCVAWTVDDLISDIQKEDPTLIKKIYLLEDCTSPVVVPGVVDYTEEADGSFRKFAAAGVNIVRSTDPIATWPGIQLP